MIEHKNKISSRAINLHSKSQVSAFYYSAKTNNNHGSVLAYALVIMSISMIILVSMLSYVSSQLKFSFNRVEKQRAFQSAEAGIYFYRWYLAHETSGKTAEEVNDFWQSGTALGIAEDYESEFEDPNGVVAGKYKIHVEQPDPGSTIVIAQATGWTYKMPEIKKTVQVRFRRPSWSENVMMANDFMRFGEGTDVYGKIHSNKGVRFDGTAYNVVSSSVATFDDPDHSGINEFGVHTHRRVPPGTGTSSLGLVTEAPPTDPVPDRNDVFLAGRQFPVSEISFTGVSSDLTFLKKTACNYNEGTQTCAVVNNCTSSGCYFNSSGYGRRIVFNSNGTMSVRVVDDYDKDAYDIYNRTLYQGLGTISDQSSATTYNIPENGIIFVEDNVWLEGSVNNKRITVVAANLIDGASPGTGNAFLGTTNLTYADFNKDNCLGVIAQNSVEILQTSQDYLTIDAALLAQNGRVGRKYYTCNTWAYNNNGTKKDITDDIRYCTRSNPADHKNTITVNGSMATNLRYGFAYTDETGYTNRILNFDNNLIYYPPPYFPTGTEYSIDLWEEL